MRTYRSRSLQRRLAVTAAVVATVATVGVAETSSTQAAAPRSAAASAPTIPWSVKDCPWLKTSLTNHLRVNMLVRHMTLEQQVSLMGLHNGGDYTDYQVYTNPIPELCVPAITQGDGPDRVRKEAVGSTDFPAPITLAASFDPGLAGQFGKALGSEFHDKGVMMAHAPNSNLARVPEWGRIFETFGEDTYLTTAMGDSEIRAIQDQGIIADVKHIAEYNQEEHVHPLSYWTNPPQNEVSIDERTMRETEFSIFESAFRDAHALAGMCSFTVINGTPACQNPEVMDFVRKDVGFQGMIRSDRPSTITDVPAAVALGMDQSFDISSDTILSDVRAGLIPEEQIARAAQHILLPVFQAGIMDQPWHYTPEADVSTPAHQAAAQTIAERGAVLLRNQDDVLPLSSAAGGSIAVIGAAASTDVQSDSSPDVVTPLQGIQERAGSDTSVTYVEGDGTGDPAQDAPDIQAAAAAAKAADVAIVVVGVGGGEANDLSEPTLAGDGVRTDQDQLIATVAAANPRTIVVLNTANPVLMPWNDDVAGIVEAWRPGQVNGTAIARVLFGDVDPSGKLPLTFPASADQTLSADPERYPGVDGHETYSEGLDIGYKWQDAQGTTPLYPFGFGLSYTDFAFRNVTVTKSAGTAIGRLDPGARPNQVVAKVHAVVTNTGSRTGREVAQLYLGHPASADEPMRQLRGFKPVDLAPGASTRVTFRLTARDLAHWDVASSGWQIAPGRFRLWVGDSSAVQDLPLRAALQMR